MKKFWKKTEGFTLVELIVVIAILGILAGVGTVGYSGYIKKANMAADQQLVSQVANALQLQYYADPTNAKSDYIILNVNADAVDGGNAFADAAMKAAFGDEWKKTAKLSYNGWEVSDVLPSKEDAEKIVASSYYQKNSPAELVSSFTGLTDALSDMANTAARNPLDTLAGIAGFEGDASTLKTQLGDMGLSWNEDEGADNSAYTTALANLMVQHTATAVANQGPRTGLVGLAGSYAVLYGWGSTTEEGAQALATLNETLSDRDTNSVEIVGAVNTAFASFQESDSYATYVDEYMMSDIMAFQSIMGTVGEWGTDADMTTSGLYSSGSITNAVNNYFAAVDVIADAEDATEFVNAINNTDGVVVYVTANGKTGCNISFD